jgi:hypothetical protein
VRIGKPPLTLRESILTLVMRLSAGYATDFADPGLQYVFPPLFSFSVEKSGSAWQAF